MLANFIFVIVFITLSNVLVANSSPLENKDDIDRQDLINFINEVKENANFEVDPCDDFSKYACGNMKSLDKPVTLWRFETILRKLFIDEDPKNGWEKAVKNLYQNCEAMKHKDDQTKVKEIFDQIDIFKSFGKFPVQKNDFNEKDVAELVAQCSIDAGGLIIVEPSEPKPENIDIVFSPGRRFALEGFDKFVTLFSNDTTPENKKIIDNVKKFGTDLEKIIMKDRSNDNEDFVNIQSIEELKQLYPSKHFDWKTYSETILKNWRIEKTIGKMKVVHSSWLKDIIELIDETDYNTLINAQIYIYATHLKRTECGGVLDLLMRPALFHRIWNDAFVNEKTMERRKYFLDFFEKDLNRVKEILPNSSFGMVTRLLETKRYVADNYKTLITDSFLDEFYGEYQYDKFYKNSNSYFRIFLKIGFQESKYPKDKALIDIFSGKYDFAVPIDLANKPFTYYFITEYFDLWFRYFQDNNFLGWSAQEKYLNEIGEYDDTSDDGNSFFMAANAALFMFMTSNRRLNKGDEIYLKELKEIRNILKQETLYALSLGQHLCRQGQHEKNSPIFRAFKQIPEFGKNFGCKQGDYMVDFKKNVLVEKFFEDNKL